MYGVTTIPRIPDSFGTRPVPRVNRSIATVRNAGGVAEAAGAFGAGIADMAGRAVEKQDKLALGAANAALLKADIEARADLADDPDYGTFAKRYNERMATARASAGKLIQSNSDRGLFEQSSQVDVARGLAVVNGLARGKEAVAGKATLDQSGADLIDVAANAPDEATRTSALNTYSDMVAGAEKKGYLDAVEAGNYRRKFGQDTTEQRLKSLGTAGNLPEARKLLEASRGRLDQNTESAMDSWLTGLEQRRQGFSDADAAMSAITAPPVVAKPGAAEGRVAFIRQVGGVESGGDDNAKNPNSSASGRFQFTKDTWEGLGGNWANRFNSGEQTRLMDKLTNQNEAALKRGGITLTAGNYYLAHFAGAGGARALHSNPNAPVEVILGAEAVKANPFLRGMKARDVIDWAAQKMGAEGGGNYSAAPDVGQAYGWVDNQAKANPDEWPPERVERAKEQVSVQINRIKQAESQVQQEAYDRVMATAAEVGDDLTDVSQYGPDYGKLSGTQKITAQNIAQANARAVQAEGNAAAMERVDAARARTEFSLKNIEQDNPEKFATMDLAPFMPGLSAAQTKKLIERQRTVGEALKGWTPYSQINAAVTRAANMGGLKLKGEDKVAVRQIMQGEAERLHKANGGKPITFKEYDALLIAATREVSTTDGGTNARFNINPGDKAEAEITAAYKRLNGGREPTEAEVMSIYRRTYVQKP